VGIARIAAIARRMETSCAPDERGACGVTKRDEKTLRPVCSLGGRGPNFALGKPGETR
jgi:hypothetical protein